jgi:hypothetical protein
VGRRRGSCGMTSGRLTPSTPNAAEPMTAPSGRFMRGRTSGTAGRHSSGCASDEPWAARHIGDAVTWLGCSPRPRRARRSVSSARRSSSDQLSIASCVWISTEFQDCGAISAARLRARLGFRDICRSEGVSFNDRQTPAWHRARQTRQRRHGASRPIPADARSRGRESKRRTARSR